MPDLPFLRFTVTSAIASFLRSVDAGSAAAELGVPTTEQLAAATAQKVDKFTPGRTLLTSGPVIPGDFGTMLSLAGFTLSEGAASLGSQILVKGPGLVEGTFGGTVTLEDGESGVWISDASGNLDLLSLARLRRSLRTAGTTPPVDPLEGDEWFNTTSKRSFVFNGTSWIEQPFTTTLTGFLYADGTSISSAKAADSAATADTLVIRGSEGQASFSGTSGSALTGTYTSAFSSTDKAGVQGSSNALGSFGVFGLHTGSGNGWGVHGRSTNGFGGVWGVGTSGIGVQGTSTTGTGGAFSTTDGDYHARFGAATGDDRSAIERVRGWFVWFYTYLGVVRVGRLKTADITANRDWVLPNSSGTLALTSQANGSIKSADIADASTSGEVETVPRLNGAGRLAAVSFFAVTAPGAESGAVLGSDTLTLIDGSSHTVSFTTSGTTLDNNRTYAVPNGSGVLALTDDPAGTPTLVKPPTTDPGIEGVVWNDGGVLRVSAGAP